MNDTYRITIQNSQGGQGQPNIVKGIAIVANGAPVDFNYDQLTAPQKATYDAFVAMIKTL